MNAGTKRKRLGSRVGRETFHRNRFVSHKLLMFDYFVSGRTFVPYVFQRRFNMTERLFSPIMNDMHAKYQDVLCYHTQYGRRG